MHASFPTFQAVPSMKMNGRPLRTLCMHWRPCTSGHATRGVGSYNYFTPSPCTQALLLQKKCQCLKMVFCVKHSICKWFPWLLSPPPAIWSFAGTIPTCRVVSLQAAFPVKQFSAVLIWNWCLYFWRKEFVLYLFVISEPHWCTMQWDFVVCHDKRQNCLCS